MGCAGSLRNTDEEAGVKPGAYDTEKVYRVTVAKNQSSSAILISTFQELLRNRFTYFLNAKMTA